MECPPHVLRAIVTVIALVAITEFVRSAAADEPLDGSLDQQGYLGMSVEQDEPGSPVRVSGVKPQSPAAVAGVQTGDELLTFNGQAVRDVDTVADLLTRMRPGARVTLGLRRSGQTRSVQVTLAQRADGLPETVPPLPLGERLREKLREQTRGKSGDGPAAPGTAVSGAPGAGAAGGAASAAAATRASLGVTVAPLSDEARQRYGVQVRRGALVTSMRAGGPAERAGMRVGAIIVGVDGVRVDTPDDLVDALRDARAGQLVELTYYVGDEMRRTKAQVAAPDAANDSGRIGILRGARESSRRVVESLPSALPSLTARPGAARKLPPPDAEAIDPSAEPEATPVPGRPATSSEELEQLRQEVSELRELVKLLEARLERLEQPPATEAPNAAERPTARQDDNPP
ncbi:MAG TPA: PDZ domain-containing protein [Pirellulaceae bacterium]|nr:PDZ domain-containing protein [Pirellulaceae bacterium]